MVHGVWCYQSSDPGSMGERVMNLLYLLYVIIAVLLILFLVGVLV